MSYTTEDVTVSRDFTRYHVNQLGVKVNQLRQDLDQVTRKAQQALNHLDVGHMPGTGVGGELLGQAARDAEFRAAEIRQAVNFVVELGATDADLAAALDGRWLSE